MYKVSKVCFPPAGMQEETPDLTPDLSDVASITDDVVVRRMVALFDYDPWENSPNMDSEVSYCYLYKVC